MERAPRAGVRMHWGSCRGPGPEGQEGHRRRLGGGAWRGDSGCGFLTASVDFPPQQTDSGKKVG